MDEIIQIDKEQQAAPALRLKGEGGWKSLLIKGIISFVAIGVILYKIGVGSLLHTLGGLDPLWLGGAAAFVLASIAVSAAKWGVCAGALDLPHNFWQLTRYYFMGFFFNNFLPSSVGGDVVRIWKLGAADDKLPAAAASVVGERLVALFTPTALLGIAFCSLKTPLAVGSVWAATLIPMIAALIFAWLLRNPDLGEKTMETAAGSQFGAVKKWTVKAAREMGVFLRNPRALLGTVALTAVFQVCVAGVNYCLLRGLGAHLGLGEVLVYSSVALAVSMLPVSIAGHGIREVAYWYFFGLAGVSKTDAVSTSLLFFVLVALMTLPGALFFVLDKKDKKGSAHE